MKHWVTFLYFTVWFGSMLWCTSCHFIDAEITPKWHCAIFGTTLFFFISAGRAFHQSHPTLPFITVSWAVMLCASSQALFTFPPQPYQYAAALTTRRDCLPHLPFPCLSASSLPFLATYGIVLPLGQASVLSRVPSWFPNPGQECLVPAPSSLSFSR